MRVSVTIRVLVSAALRRRGGVAAAFAAFFAFATAVVAAQGAAPRLEPARTLTVGGGVARGLAFAPDGASLVSGGEEGDLVCWGLGDRRALWRRDAGTHPIGEIRFSPDGRLVACMGRDLAVWSRAGERLLQRPAGGARGVAFSDDGRLLAFHTGGGGVEVLAATPPAFARVARFAGDGRHPIQQLAFEPDGRALRAGDSVGRIWRLELASGAAGLVEDSPAGDEATSRVSVAALGRLGAGWVRAYAAGQVWLGERRVEHAGGLYVAAVEAAAGLIATAGPDRLRVWDATGAARAELELAAGATAVAIAPAGDRVALATAAGRVQVYAVTAAGGLAPAVELPGHPSQVEALAFSADGAVLAAAGADTRLLGLDGGSDVTIPGNLSVGTGPRATELLVLARDLLEVVDGRTSEVRRAVPLPAERGALGDRLWLAPGGDRVLLGTDFFSAPLEVRLADGEVSALKGFGRLLDVAFHPRGGLYALGRVSGNHGESGGLEVRAQADGALRHEHDTSCGVDAVAWSPSGAQLVYAFGGGSLYEPVEHALVRLDGATFAERERVAAHVAWWRFVDEDYAVAHDHQELQVWSVAPLRRLAAVPVPGGVREAAMAPDRRTLAVSGPRRVRVFRLRR